TLRAPCLRWRGGAVPTLLDISRASRRAVGPSPDAGRPSEIGRLRQGRLRQGRLHQVPYAKLGPGWRTGPTWTSTREGIGDSGKRVPIRPTYNRGGEVSVRNPTQYGNFSAIARVMRLCGPRTSASCRACSSEKPNGSR